MLSKDENEQVEVPLRMVSIHLAALEHRAYGDQLKRRTHTDDHALLARSWIAAVSKNGEQILSAAMIVGEPNPLVGGIHDRMPVMLLPEDYDAWLGSTTAPEDLRNLLRPYDESLMEAYAVSRKVNSVKNDTEECIEPIDDN